MAETPSTMLPLGTSAPDFKLPDPSGKFTSLADFKNSPALLVAFISNHCPFVKHIRKEFAFFAKEYQGRGVGVVAIGSNDVANYPQDGPEKMAEEIKQIGYTFPYLYDETQEVAKAYQAACTPDFFLFDGNHRLVYRGQFDDFDGNHRLVYRGQFDDSRPSNGRPVTGKDLRNAVDAVLAGRAISRDQKPSVGCNIKWKRENAPDYFKK